MLQEQVAVLVHYNGEEAYNRVPDMGDACVSRKHTGKALVLDLSLMPENRWVAQQRQWWHPCLCHASSLAGPRVVLWSCSYLASYGVGGLLKVLERWDPWYR